jgi:hypothetical protein
LVANISNDEPVLFSRPAEEQVSERGRVYTYPIKDGQLYKERTQGVHPLCVV